MLRFRLIFVAVLLAIVLTVVVAQDDTLPYQNPELPVEDRVADLLERMTLEEKIGQMTLIEKNSISPAETAENFVGAILSGGGGYPQGNNTPEGWMDMVHSYQDAALSTRLAIPMIYGVDAVHGHSNVIGAVIFPHNIGLGATRNAELLEEIGQVTALEMIATGIYWDYSPVLAVVRDYRWGRSYEGYSEDTSLVTELSAAMLRGLQGDDLSAPDTVLGTPKHFVGDGGTAFGTSTVGLLDRGDAIMDEETFREVHVAPYYAALEEGARSIMISYSSYNGERMHGNSYLINEVLIDEMGFEGFIVSDWAGIDDVAPVYYDAVVQAINAGIDMNMVPYDYDRFISTMNEAVESGDISMERIDEAVSNILQVKFEMGLFERPYGDEALLDVVGSEDHRAVARDAVAQSLVLLKNENDALPIAKDAEQTVFVAGQGADNLGLMSGGWTIEWQGVSSNVMPGTTILEGLQAGVGESVDLQYDAGGDFDDATADVGIVVVGERPYAEMNGDNADLSLTNQDYSLVADMREKVDTLVVILLSGRPMVIDQELNMADAFVAAWLPGTEGNGVSDVLLGDRDFSGTLPFTWLRNIDQLPFDYGTIPTEGCESPLFPFGYGLTYAGGNEASQPYLELASECGGEAREIAEVEAGAVVQTGDFAMINDFEGDVLLEGVDEFGNGIGVITFGDSSDNVSVEIGSVERDGETSNALVINYDSSGWGGIIEQFTDGENWIGQDWSAFDNFNFSLYGNNTGDTIMIEILDNRNPNIPGDSAERWLYRIDDDYEGWKDFSISLDNFQRRGDWQPGGAPDDGFSLVSVSGYAFSFPVGTGPMTAYLDNVAITSSGVEPLVVDDFEMDELFMSQDSEGSNIGFVTWGDSADNVELSLVELERAGEMTTVLKAEYQIAQFGGFTHVFTDGSEWVGQNWRDYNAISFVFFGDNTGEEIQFEIFDNRNPDASGDTAERWYYRFADDQFGWRKIDIPFEDFQRRGDWQPGGALDDGFNLDDVSGYAFGFPTGLSRSHIALIDNVTLFYMQGAATADELAAPSTGGAVEVEEATTVEASVEESVIASEPMVIDAFEMDELFLSQDSEGSNIGYVPWGDGAENVILSLVEVERDGETTTALQGDYQSNVFGGFTHVFNDGVEWVGQNWRAYNAIRFYFSGSNTGEEIQFEIFDNRNPDAPGDSAERWFYRFTDDQEGWRLIEIPFEAFQRRGDWQPGGAPADGFNLDDVSGYAFGLPIGLDSRQIALIDDVTLFVMDGAAMPNEIAPPTTGGVQIEDVTAADGASDGGETASAGGTGPTVVIEDFEGDVLIEGRDAIGNGIGAVSWSDSGQNVALSVVEVERDGETTNALQADYVAGEWGGLTYAFTDGENWVSQDWSVYDSLNFSLYGTNTGGAVQVEIFDNRNPDLPGDSAERYFYRINDDFEGWQDFSIGFDSFQRRSDFQPGGAPSDGLTLTEVHGVAFGLPVNLGPQVTYIDNITISSSGIEPQVVDDFEMDELVIGVDSGLIPWGDTPGNVELSLVELERNSAMTTVLKAEYQITAFGGFSNVFTNGETPGQNWRNYNAISFMFFGENTGGEVQFEIFDNRSPVSTGDTAERWYYRFVDDRFGWRKIDIPFEAFQRRSDWQPDGAPDDGFNLDDVSGYAFGFPAGLSRSHIALIDDVNVFFMSGAATPDMFSEPSLSNTIEVELAELVEIDESIDWNSREWELIWADEFDADAGEPISEANWTCEVGGWGWGNNEHQYYTTSTDNGAHDGNGNFIITAREEVYEDDTCWYGECQYTSARCVTQDKFEFTYGRVEARLQIPTGQGIWPAFWMLGADFPDVPWPDSGEIDIMENVGHEPMTVHGTVHGPGYSGGAGVGNSYHTDTVFSEDFHVYAIDWDPNVIRWYVDGEMYGMVSRNDVRAFDWVFDHDFFMIMNIAVGGNWPGYPDETTEFPQQMLVDYIRVYQLAD